MFVFLTRTEHALPGAYIMIVNGLIVFQIDTFNLRRIASHRVKIEINSKLSLAQVLALYKTKRNT